jgi:hypothetical protein
MKFYKSFMNFDSNRTNIQGIFLGVQELAFVMLSGLFF